MSTTLPDYEALAQQLSFAGASIAPAELHGIVCGLLCMVGRAGATAWLGDQLRQFDGPPADIEAVGSMLEVLESASWAALSGTEMQFEPILPSDDADLFTRTSALGEWCLGFVGGLALGGWTDAESDDGSAEVAEVVNDFSAISNAGLDDADSGDIEEAETSYVELAEYVRVGVQFVFETMASLDDGSPGPTIH